MLTSLAYISKTLFKLCARTQPPYHFQPCHHHHFQPCRRHKTTIASTPQNQQPSSCFVCTPSTLASTIAAPFQSPVQSPSQPLAFDRPQQPPSRLGRGTASPRSECHDQPSSLLLSTSVHEHFNRSSLLVGGNHRAARGTIRNTPRCLH